MTDTHDFEALSRFACRLADAARPAALGPFRSASLTVDNKADDGAFDPVTRADQATEAAIRALIDAERPQDGIFGEEQGKRESRSGLTWIIDPIDGTRAYMSGLPTWGVLIGLHDGHRPVLGVMDQPFIGERFLGRVTAPSTAVWTRAQETRDLSVRPCPALDQATLFTTSPALFNASDRAAYDRVEASVRLPRYGMDCYAYCMVAGGHADLVIEAGLSAYDIAALIPIIEAAGGVVTDWQGGPCDQGGQVVAAGDPRLHEQALALLSAP